MLLLAGGRPGLYEILAQIAAGEMSEARKGILPLKETA
jgi:hypothetical protein